MNFESTNQTDYILKMSEQILWLYIQDFTSKINFTTDAANYSKDKKRSIQVVYQLSCFAGHTLLYLE